jgi:hypothetical protein
MGNRQHSIPSIRTTRCLGSAPRGPARDHQECPEQDQDLDRPLQGDGLVSARRRAEDDGDQESGRQADQGESAKNRMSSHAERPRVLRRLCATGGKTPDEANQAAAQWPPAA